MSKRKRKSRRRDASSASSSQAPSKPLTEEIKIAIESWGEEAADVVGVELVDVEFSTPGQWLVRVYAQRPGNPGPGQGITIDQCNIVGHSDGGCRPNCSAGAWVIDVVVRRGTEECYERIATGGTFLKSRVDSFEAEGIALDRCKQHAKTLISRRPAGT